MRRLPGLTCTTSIPRFLWRETESSGHSGWTGSAPPKHSRPAGGTENSWPYLSHPDPGQPPVWGRLLNPATYWSWMARGGGLASARLGVLITGSSSTPSPQEHPARLSTPWSRCLRDVGAPGVGGWAPSPIAGFWEKPTLSRWPLLTLCGGHPPSTQTLAAPWVQPWAPRRVTVTWWPASDTVNANSRPAPRDLGHQNPSTQTPLR